MTAEGIGQDEVDHFDVSDEEAVDSDTET